TAPGPAPPCNAACTVSVRRMPRPNTLPSSTTSCFGSAVEGSLRTSFTESQPATTIPHRAAARSLEPLMIDFMNAPQIPDSRQRPSWVALPCVPCCGPGLRRGPFRFPSEPHPHAHAIGPTQDVVVLGAGAGDAAAGERRALVEQVGDRAEHLELLQLAHLQVVGAAEAEVEVRLDAVVVDAAQQEFAFFIAVVGACGVVAPVLVQLRATDVAGIETHRQVTDQIRGGEVARPGRRCGHAGDEHTAADLTDEINLAGAVV